MCGNLNDDKVNPGRLEEVAGGTGADSSGIQCPACGSTNITKKYLPISTDFTTIKYTCNDCGHSWTRRLNKTTRNPRPQVT